MSSYWSDKEFIEIIQKSNTISEVLKHFKCPTNQGHYNRVFHKSVERLQIDISHLREGAKAKSIFYTKIPTDKILVKGTFRNTKNLKERLIKEGLLTNHCYDCKLPPEWNGKELKMHLDHVNGDNTDNTLENLRLLCPNCHSQTDTYCGAKSKKEKHAYKYVCKTCNGPKKMSKSENCVKCQNNSKPTKIEWPAHDVVLQMTNDLGFSETGRKLGVSDNAIRKFLKRTNG